MDGSATGANGNWILFKLNFCKKLKKKFHAFRNLGDWQFANYADFYWTEISSNCAELEKKLISGK